MKGSLTRTNTHSLFVGVRTPKVSCVACLPLKLTTTQNLPIIILKCGEAYATSRNVAAVFGKEHKNVLRDIDTILENLHGSDLGHGWFIEIEYPHPTVFGRSIRTFDMTRDGLALLVMGYTGPKAMEFKVRYIQQFNAMEEALRNQTPVSPSLPQNFAEALRLAADQAEQSLTEGGCLVGASHPPFMSPASPEGAWNSVALVR